MPPCAAQHSTIHHHPKHRSRLATPEPPLVNVDPSPLRSWRRSWYRHRQPRQHHRDHRLRSLGVATIEAHSLCRSPDHWYAHARWHPQDVQPLPCGQCSYRQPHEWCSAMSDMTVPKDSPTTSVTTSLRCVRGSEMQNDSARLAMHPARPHAVATTLSPPRSKLQLSATADNSPSWQAGHQATTIRLIEHSTIDPSSSSPNLLILAGCVPH